jgi:DNA polymerase-4
MRKILHVDMDAFYASVEQRDHPQWRGQPVLVGGDGRRGVVCAASYEARAFGARSAMPMHQARSLCPGAIVAPPRFGVYHQVSAEIQAILRKYTHKIEPIALDESYLDVSELPAKAGQVAQEIRRQIWQRTGLTASAGVAPNKLVAKIASGFRKPNAMTIVPPEQVESFLAPLPIGKLWGVGPVHERRFLSLGIPTIGTLAHFNLGLLAQHFGHWAPYWQKLARGQDEREVESCRETRSVSAEVTFDDNVESPVRLLEALAGQSEQVSQRLRELAMRARTVTLKLRFADFSTITRSSSLRDPIGEGPEIFERAQQLLLNQGELSPIRLIGLGCSNLTSMHAPRQLEFDF